MVVVPSAWLCVSRLWQVLLGFMGLALTCRI